ncbi:MAG: porin family protein [Desulfovibrionaceae bacterium]|nr:porin family protein [Desulfovibrionaceae bacterium]
MRTLLLTAVLTLAFAFAAYAGDTGVYAGIKVMDSYQSTGKISSSGHARHFDTGEHSQNTLGMGFFVGYDFYKRNKTPIRAEIEYALRGTVNTDYDLKHSSGVHQSISNEYTLHTIFANAYYDFHNESKFTPYVGGGLGLAIINSKYELEVDTGSRNYSDSFNDTNTSLAYNLGLGCSYDFSDALAADLGYRFVGTSYHETDKKLYGSKIGIGMANYANEFSLGLRFNF